MWPSRWNAREPVEHAREPEMDVWRGGIDAELHPQRRPTPDLLREQALGEHVDGVAGDALECVDGHGAGIVSRAHRVRRRSTCGPTSAIVAQPVRCIAMRSSSRMSSSAVCAP